jgi:site-specific recombinase XerD
MVERAAASARLGIKAHAHMRRHACGYKLANDGHDTRAVQAVWGIETYVMGSYFSVSTHTPSQISIDRPATTAPMACRSEN